MKGNELQNHNKLVDALYNSLLGKQKPLLNSYHNDER